MTRSVSLSTGAEKEPRDHTRVESGEHEFLAGLSPFSTEALALLDGTGCRYQKVELGPEWFLLDGPASATRNELLLRTGQSSLPHVFIGGRSVGGLYSGNAQGEVGLVQLKKEGRLEKFLLKVFQFQCKEGGRTKVFHREETG